MTNIRNKPLIIACLSILLISGIGCASKSTTPAVPTQTVAVQRGNLAITASVDGNLVMPQAFDLHFGAPGDVKDVLVQEGDRVKAGAVLATLDDRTQTLAVRSANNAVQTVLSNLYETVPLFPQFPEHSYKLVPVDPTDLTKGDKLVSIGIKDSAVVYPFYYPNSTTLTSFVWAQEEVSRAQALLQSGKNVETASELYVALADLEACINIIEDAIHNPDSGLGSIAPFVNQEEATFWLQQYDTSGILFIDTLQKLAEQIKQNQTALEKLRTSLTEGNYAEADSAFRGIARQMEQINLKLTDNVNRIEKRNNTTVYGRDIGFHFYGAAEKKLDAALAGIEAGGLRSPDLDGNLRIAQHYIQLCNAILGSNELVLQHGLSLKSEHQYNIDLANALVNLENTKTDFLNTVILSPYDGIVVSVGVKKNDVLSAIDYSSKGTIKIVDTSQIKFQGMVDEIDILKVKTGQKATISVDAVPNKTFTGTVSFISPYGTANTSNVVQFAVTILLDPADVDLKGGLSTTADITIASVNNVLIVPLAAVTTTPAGSFVTAINPATGQSEKKQVTLGKQNQQYAEISSGLQEGDKIIIQERAVSGAPVTTRPQFGPPGGGGGPSR